MTRKYSFIVFATLSIISSCTSAPILEETSTSIPSIESTAAIAPTPTLDPTGDPDGDGYQTSFEEAWGTDPLAFTSFEELEKLDRTITGTAHIRKPYDLDSMNQTVYQQVEFIDEQMLDELNSSWQTLSIKFVLFPYVTEIVYEYAAALKYPYLIKNGLEEYLEPHTATDTCLLEEEMMEPIMESSETLNQLASNISSWNHENLLNDRPKLIELYTSEYKVYDSYSTLVSIPACFMMEKGILGHSTCVANKSASDFKTAGIPAGIAFSFDPTDVDKMTLEKLAEWRCMFNHPQTVIWTPKYGWIIYDHNAKISGSREEPYYTPLLITDIAPDFSYIDLLPWYTYNDWLAGRTNSSPNWLFYSENVRSAEEYSSTVKPAESNPCGN